jgi:hypothetical protein
MATECTGRLRFEAPLGFAAVGDPAAEWNGVALAPSGPATGLEVAAAELRARLMAQRAPAHAASALLGEAVLPGGGIAFAHHVSRYDGAADGKVTALLPAGHVLVRAEAGYGRGRDRAAAFAEIRRLAEAAGPMPAAGTEIDGLCLDAALFRVPTGRTEIAFSTWGAAEDDGVILALRYARTGEPHYRSASDRPADVEIGARHVGGELAETLIQIVEGPRGHSLLRLQIPPAGATSMLELSVELRRLSGGPSDAAPAGALRAWFDGVLGTLRLAE